MAYTIFTRIFTTSCNLFHQALCDIGSRHWQRGDGGVEISGAVQGTTYHIKLGAESRTTDLDALNKNTGQLFADIDQKLSNYREDSEISCSDQQQTLGWGTVSRELTYLIDLAQGVSHKTNGCFDLTLSSVGQGFTVAALTKLLEGAGIQNYLWKRPAQ